MTQLTIYCAPRAVSRAVLMVLEEKGIPFTAHMIDLAKSEQLKPEFLAINPKGKVPALLVDGQLLTETPAIFTYLDARFPEHEILPKGDALARAQVLADMVWLASGVHPNFPLIYRTPRYCDIESVHDRMRAQARALIGASCDTINARLEGREWWLDQWSALDPYVNWIWLLLERTGIEAPAERWPAFAAHAARMAARPAVQRALDHEKSV